MARDDAGPNGVVMLGDGAPFRHAVARRTGWCPYHGDMSMPPPPPPGWGHEPQPQWGGTPPPPGFIAHGQYGMTRQHPQGTTILVLGILSLVVCGLLGPFAWSMGSKALREMDAGSDMWTNRGSVSAGRICGIISTCLLAVGIVFFLLFAVLATSSRS